MADHGAEDLVPRLQAVFARRARGDVGRGTEGGAGVSARGRSDGSEPVEVAAAMTAVTTEPNG